ncbi:antitoxin VapB family protein [Candidatus Woesearchaeota archaeon]|nr:antitoxin VapB family protein [Candidatus Woesearchaeota archaeon]
MAKTIMISNEVYNELKGLKRDKSFSELFKDLLKSNEVKRVSGLMDCVGIMKNDKDWEKLEKERKIAWKNWTKKYV